MLNSDEDQIDAEDEPILTMVKIAVAIEKHAQSMRLGTTRADHAALCIVELLKQIPSLPE